MQDFSFLPVGVIFRKKLKFENPLITWLTGLILILLMSKP